MILHTKWEQRILGAERAELPEEAQNNRHKKVGCEWLGWVFCGNMDVRGTWASTTRKFTDSLKK